MENETPTYSHWLESLKIGNVVCIPGYGIANKDYCKVTVKRVTPSGRIVVVDSSGNETTFDKNGYKVGRTKWDFTRLSQLTEEMIDVRNDYRRRQIIKNYSFDQLSPQDIKQVYDLLKTLPCQKDKEAS